MRVDDFAADTLAGHSGARIQRGDLSVQPYRTDGEEAIRFGRCQRRGRELEKEAAHWSARQAKLRLKSLLQHGHQDPAGPNGGRRLQHLHHFLRLRRRAAGARRTIRPKLGQRSYSRRALSTMPPWTWSAVLDKCRDGGLRYAHRGGLGFWPFVSIVNFAFIKSIQGRNLVGSMAHST